VALPSAYRTAPVPDRRETKGRLSRYAGPLLFAAIGISLAVGARWLRQSGAPPDRSAPPPPVAVVPGPAAAAAPVVVPPANAPVVIDDEPEPGVGSSAASPPELPVELPISEKDKAKLGAGEGLLEVVTGRGDEIYVDGVRIGKGPVRKVAVKANTQPHEVRVKLRGEERVRYVTAKEGARIRIRVAPPWSN
jgi:hypothetical protein